MGTTRSQIIDMDAHEDVLVRLEVEGSDVYDMAKLAADIGKNVQVSDIKASLKPNGKTKIGVRQGRPTVTTWKSACRRRWAGHRA